MFESTEAFVSLFFSQLELLSHHNIILFVAAFWCIWKRRNQKICEDIELRPSVSLQLVRDIIYQWKTAQESRQRQQTGQRCYFATCSSNKQCSRGGKKCHR
jgi:hypothetical protein